MRMVQEVFKVEELGFDLLILVYLDILAVFFILLSLFVISGQEPIETFNSWQLKHSWKFKHEDLLVLNVIDFKDLEQKHLD